MNNIVLVHGAFVDGSGWEGVYKILRRDGYSVSIVQNPTISLEDDVAVTKRTLAGQDGPTILVGHSYGGAVITEAGNDPKVTALVYIAAFSGADGSCASPLHARSLRTSPENASNLRLVGGAEWIRTLVYGPSPGRKPLDRLR